MNLVLLLTIFGAFLLAASALAFIRAKDVFAMISVIKITNFYIVPLLLILFAIDKFSLLTFVKILIIAILNLITTILLCHAIARRAIADKIEPDADFVDVKKKK